MKDHHDIYAQYLRQTEPWRQAKELMDSLDPMRSILSPMKEALDQIPLSASAVAAAAADRFGLGHHYDTVGLANSTAAEIARMVGGSSVAAQAALSAEQFALEARKMRDIASAPGLTEWSRHMPSQLLSDVAMQASAASLSERMAWENTGLKSMEYIYAGGIDSNIAEEIRKITEENSALSAVTKLLEEERLITEKARKLGMSTIGDISRSYLADTIEKIQNSFMRDPIVDITSSGSAALRQQMFAEVSLSSAMEQALKGLLPSLEEPTWQARALRQAGFNTQSMEELLRQIDPTMAAFEAAKASLDSRVAGLSEIDWNSFSDQYDIEPEDTKTHIDDMSVAMQQQTDLQAMVAVIIAHTGHLQPKIQAVVLTYVLLPLVVFLRNLWNQAPGVLLSVSIGAYLNTTNHSTSPQEISKSTQQVAQDTVRSPEIPKEFSLVSTEDLAVLLNPRSQSPNLGRLKYGSVVRILDRSGAFALIEWMDDKGEVRLQGWVYSRYLRKFI